MYRDPLGVVGVVGLDVCYPCCDVQMKELSVGLKDICPDSCAAEERGEDGRKVGEAFAFEPHNFVLREVRDAQMCERLDGKYLDVLLGREDDGERGQIHVELKGLTRLP